MHFLRLDYAVWGSTDITPFLATGEIMARTHGVRSGQWFCRHLLLLVTRVPTLRAQDSLKLQLF